MAILVYRRVFYCGCLRHWRPFTLLLCAKKLRPMRVEVLEVRTCQVAPSQKETNLPTIHFQVRTVSFREDTHWRMRTMFVFWKTFVDNRQNVEMVYMVYS